MKPKPFVSFLNIFIYLFYYLSVLGLSCDTLGFVASGGMVPFRAQTLVVVHGLTSWGKWA